MHAQRGQPMIAFIDQLWVCRLQRKLGQLILKRFLLFVLLLERLATSDLLPPNVPLMFRLDSTIKSSREV